MQIARIGCKYIVLVTPKNLSQKYFLKSLEAFHMYVAMMKGSIEGSKTCQKLKNNISG